MNQTNGCSIKLPVWVWSSIVSIGILLFAQGVYVWSETKHMEDNYAKKDQFEVVKEKVCQLEKTQEQLIEKIDRYHDEQMNLIIKLIHMNGGKNDIMP